MRPCPFCLIGQKKAEFSKVYEDSKVIAIIPLKPIYPGACVIFPKVHIDHFTDLPDDLAAHLMIVAQKISRKVMSVYQPARMGMVVHGFGVPHAHLNLLPQHGPFDITSQRLTYLKDGEIHFGEEMLKDYSRTEMDELARQIAIPDDV